MHKLSYYNFYIPYKEFKVYLLFNSLSSGLCEIDWEKGERIKELGLKNLDKGYDFQKILTEEEFNLMVHHNMITSINKNEKEEIENHLLSLKDKLLNARELVFTICPTLGCNLACLYCYEGEKKYGYMSNDTIDQLMSKAKDIIEKNSIEKLRITWLGGEPLLCPDIIENISKKFIKMSNDYGIPYEGCVVTNGTKLGKEIWNMLVNSNVKQMQVSIDGTKKTHDKKRPLKSAGSSFDLTINSLKHYRDEISLTIRIHADKEVTAELPMLLTELDKINLWPQNAKTVYLDLVQKKVFDGVSKEDKSIYYTEKEFYREFANFKQLQFDYYNNWAQKNNKNLAKRKLDYPTLRLLQSYCPTAHNPNILVIDDKGSIHKCWVPVNTKDSKIEHISQFTNTNKPLYKKWEDFEKFKVEDCGNCKFFPICEAGCVNDFFIGKVYCSKWKFIIKENLKFYYRKKYIEFDKTYCDINDIKR